MASRALQLAAILLLALSVSGSGPERAREGLGPGGTRPLPGAAAAVEEGGIRSASGSVAWVEREAYVMGTLLRIRLAAGDRLGAVRASEAALEAVEGLEDVLSTWREDAELARVNRAPVGEPVTLSPTLTTLLEEAFRWRRRSGGAFEPAAGALVDVWDLRGDGRRPAPGELAGALASTGPATIRMSPEEATLTRLSADAWVDAGGFGKGAALRRAGEVLRELGVERALLDFGGQLLALGSGPRGPGGWRVSVAHPRARERTVARLRIADVSVATTGTSERFVAVKGDTLGHVLDPRTGQPVPAWGSVTVVAPDPLDADVLSTALFVRGPEGALERARELQDAAVLVVESGPGAPSVRWSPSMERWLTEEARRAAAAATDDRHR